MSNVSYVKCDMCGESVDEGPFRYRIRGKGFRYMVGSIFGQFWTIDLCESCWRRIEHEVRSAKERDAS